MSSCSILLYISSKIRFPYNGSMMQINTSFLVLYQRKNESLSLTRNMSSILHHQEKKKSWAVILWLSRMYRQSVLVLLSLGKKKKVKIKHNTPQKLRTRIGWSRHLGFKLCFRKILFMEIMGLWGKYRKTESLSASDCIVTCMKTLPNPNLRQLPYSHGRNVTAIPAGKWMQRSQDELKLLLSIIALYLCHWCKNKICFG